MMRYCPQCGHQVEETAVFCENCGNRLKAVTEGVDAPEKIDKSISRVSVTDEKQTNTVKSSIIRRKDGTGSFFTGIVKYRKIIIPVACAFLFVILIIVMAVVIKSCANSMNVPANPRQSFYQSKITVENVNVRIQSSLKQYKVNVLTIPYESVVEWKRGEDNIGFVKFEGTAKYGVDFDKIKVSAPDSSGLITITVPKITINHYDTNKNTFSCLFNSSKMKRNYGKSSYESEIYKLCNEKMLKDIEGNTENLKIASTYVENFILGLSEPIAESQNLRVRVIIGE